LWGVGYVSWRVFLRELWDPFENRFQEIEKRFLENASMVEKEAMAQEIVESRLDREEMKRYREQQERRQLLEDSRQQMEEKRHKSK
jgi:hypothetical protein